MTGVGEISRDEIELYISTTTASELPLADQQSKSSPTTGQQEQQHNPHVSPTTGSPPTIHALSTSCESVVD